MGGLSLIQKTKISILRNLLFFREKRDIIGMDPAIGGGLKQDKIFV